MRINEIYPRPDADWSVDIDPSVKKNPQFEMEPWRGPHEERALNLMLANKKPAALVDPSHTNRLDDFKPYIMNGRFKTAPINVFGNGKQLVITQPDQIWRAKKLQQLFRTANEKMSADPSYEVPKLFHAQVGILLGYSNYEIRKFLNVI